MEHVFGSLDQSATADKLLEQRGLEDMELNLEAASRMAEDDEDLDVALGIQAAADEGEVEKEELDACLQGWDPRYMEDQKAIKLKTLLLGTKTDFEQRSDEEALSFLVRGLELIDREFDPLHPVALNAATRSVLGRWFQKDGNAGANAEDVSADQSVKVGDQVVCHTAKGWRRYDIKGFYRAYKGADLGTKGVWRMVQLPAVPAMQHNIKALAMLPGYESQVVKLNINVVLSEGADPKNVLLQLRQQKGHFGMDPQARYSRKTTKAFQAWAARVRNVAGFVKMLRAQQDKLPPSSIFHPSTSVHCILGLSTVHSVRPRPPPKPW